MMPLIVDVRTVLLSCEWEARIARIVAERSAATVVRLRLSQRIVCVEAEVMAHALAEADVHAVVARAADRLLVANAGQNRNTRRSECSSQGTREAGSGPARRQLGIDVDRLVLMQSENMNIFRFDD